MIVYTGYERGAFGRKLPSDSTLKTWKKDDLIEWMHIAEHNYNALVEMYGNAIDNSKCHRCPLGKGKEIEKQTRKYAIKEFAENLYEIIFRIKYCNNKDIGDYVVEEQLMSEIDILLAEMEKEEI